MPARSNESTTWANASFVFVVYKNNIRKKSFKGFGFLSKKCFERKGLISWHHLPFQKEVVFHYRASKLDFFRAQFCRTKQWIISRRTDQMLIRIRRRTKEQAYRLHLLHQTSFNWYQRNRTPIKWVSTLPPAQDYLQLFVGFQSVIQPNHAQSVIHTAIGNIQPVKSVLLVNSKNPNSVIHTTHQAIQVRKCAPQQQTSPITSVFVVFR